MPAPSDKKGVERHLGTVNYLGKFISNLATVTEPIRILLRKDTEFEWSYEQDQAFQEIKAILTKDGGPVLSFFYFFIFLFFFIYLLLLFFLSESAVMPHQLG